MARTHGEAGGRTARPAVPDTIPSRVTYTRPMPMILALVFQFAASSPYATTERDQWDLMGKTVTIHRDRYGVPHIHGPTDASVVFGLMYAQAEDNFWQLEEDYLDKLGRASEVYGSSRLGADLMVHL